MANKNRLAIRWTLGDVSPYGFEALRLSVWGAWKLFGAEADYAVCVNSIRIEHARKHTGALPEGVNWVDTTSAIPDFLTPYLDGSMAEGVAWKFAPLRLFPDRYELALDNDCILWEIPEALGKWRTPANAHRCVVAEDVVAMFGQFGDLCGSEPRNGGLRGFPPGFDFEKALRLTLEAHPVKLESELDEQGLQTAALARHAKPLVVRVEEVTICSPFPPHLPHLGRCGAHFCGLNAKQLPWKMYGRPAVEYLREHWEHHRPSLHQRVSPAE